MTSKIKINAGQVEFTYESEAELSFEEVESLFSHVEKLYESAGNRPARQASTSTEGDPSPDHSGSSGQFNFHINTVAEKLGVKSGSDLARSAAAYLSLCANREVFSRSDLNGTMKEAKKYYKTTYTKNLTGSINTLLKDTINQIGSDQYSVKAGKIDEFKAKLS